MPKSVKYKDNPDFAKKLFENYDLVANGDKHNSPARIAGLMVNNSTARCRRATFNNLFDGFSVGRQIEWLTQRFSLGYIVSHLR